MLQDIISKIIWSFKCSTSSYKASVLNIGRNCQNITMYIYSIPGSKRYTVHLQDIISVRT